MAREPIDDIVYRRCLERPVAPAILHRGEATSYRDLCLSADHIATGLAGLGVRPGHIIPVVTARSPELVATLLAIMRLGAAYAILDPGWPCSRTDQVIERIGAPVVVSDAYDTAASWCPRPFEIRSLAAQGGSRGPGRGGSGLRRTGSAPRREARSASDTATVFFTSGTAGEPKGVLSPHRGVTRLFQPCPFADFSEGSVMPLSAALPWDAFSLELWGVLLNGGACVIPDEAPLLPATLRKVIAGPGVNMAWLTATLFNIFVDEDIDCFTGLRAVLVGGERLSSSHVRRFLERHLGIRLINGYGPVESTIFATTHPVTLADCDNPAGIPIGRPVPGTGILVMDGDDEIEGDAAGEICITGDGLASGYLMDSALTSEKFQEVDRPGGPVRLYRTGDIGFIKGGTLHYVGRADRQVKVRGHRVEPAAIENALRSLPQVRDSAVVAQPADGAETRLTACYSTYDGTELPPGAARLAFAGLPDYLHPHRLVLVDAMPVTPNGKLDEQALAARIARPDSREQAAAGTWAHARASDNLATVIGAFRDVLPATARIGPHTSLFQAGGTSLDAVRVCARLTSACKVTLPLSQLIAAPTPAGLADWLQERQAHAHQVPATSAGPGAAGSAPMSQIQVGMWINHLRDPSDLAQLCLATWRLRGSLDQTALSAAIGDVHQRHELLHSLFTLADKPVVVPDAGIPPPRLVRLPDARTEGEAAAALRGELGRPLDIVGGEIWRSGIARSLDSGTELFGVAVHHIAFDAASEAILSRDLSLAYAARLRGRRPRYPEAPASWRDMARACQELPESAALARQEGYWASTLRGMPELCLPKGEPAADRIGTSDIGLSEASLRPWLACARQAGGTRFTAIMAYVASRLAGCAGQYDFGIGVPVTKRANQLFDHAVACLIDPVCMRLTFDQGDISPRTAVSVTHLAARGALAAQDVPLTRVIRLAAPRRSQRHPLFQVMFALHTAATAALELPGCTSEFIRADPPRAVAEIVFEASPHPSGDGTQLHVTYQPDAVSPDFVAALAARMSRG